MKIKINCFGKLPAYQDFVIYDCTGAAATEFRKWMENAFGAQEAPGEPLDGARVSVIIADEVRKEAVLGMIRDSSDHGGLRSFPIAYFMTLPAKAVRKAASSLSILSMEDVWREIEELDESIKGSEVLQDVHERLKKWKPVSIKADKKKNHLLEWAEVDSDLETLIACLGGSEGDTPWNRLMWGIKQLGIVDGDWLGKGGIRWPLVPEYDPGFLMDLWTQLLNRQRQIAGKDPLPRLFTMICPRMIDKQHSGALVFRAMVPEDLALFRRDSDPPPGILDLTGRESPLTLDGYYGFQSELREVLDVEGTKITDLLNVDMTSGGPIRIGSTG